MAQGFDEWFFEQLGDRDETQQPLKIARMWANGAYKVGAASRQAEVDKLQKRIDDALDYVFGLYCTGDLDTERLENILKGESNE